MPELQAAVGAVIRQCLAVTEGEDVVVIVDPGTRPIGEALRDGASQAGADAVLAIMDAREHDGTEPPRPVAAALAACDVFIAPTSRSLRWRLVAQLLDEADSARLTCPLGSDFTLGLTGRAGIADDGDLTAPGAFGNLPAGEGFIAPRSGEGTIVVSSLASLGRSDEPAKLTIENGSIVAAQGGLGPELLKRLRAHGELGCNLAELGVGTNDRATLTGNVLEDEKILGTVHVAFGASAGIGGTVSVPIHLDVVILDASLEVGGRTVLDAGQYVLGA